MSNYNHLQIDWKNMEITEVSKDTWNTLVRHWKQHGTKFSAGKTINRTSKWTKFGTYKIVKNKKFSILQVNDNGDFKQYCCNSKPNNKKTADNEEGTPGSGRKAFRALKKELKEVYPEFKHSKGNCNPFKYAFGEVPIATFSKIHIPNPISFAKEKFVGQIMSNVYKADISSAYPGAGAKTLPSAHTMKTIQGIVEPTEEYPFCFYSNGHIAIYNELDSRKWPELDYGVYSHSQGKRVGDNIRFTIVMKASKYSLKPVFEKAYKYKQENFGNSEQKQYYKDLMNKTIGCLESEEFYSSTRNYRYYAGHLAAVIKARVVNQILTKCYEIQKAGGEVLSIYTDCIIWKGAGTMGVLREEKLGEFHLEAEDEYCTIGRGARYALQRKGEPTVYILKVSGYSQKKRDEWGKPLKTLENIAEFFLHAKEYFYKWNEQTEMFDKIEKEASCGRKKMGKMVQSVSGRIDF